MNCFELYKMIFYVLDNEYDKCKDEKLGNICSGMNPFLFEGESSAIEEIYLEFKKEYDERFSSVCSLEQGLEFGKAYAYKTKIKKVIEAFEKITMEEWENAYIEMKEKAK